MNTTTNKNDMKTTAVKKNPSALANDTLTMMQLAFADLSQRRCHFLKSDLTKEFKTLCAVDNSVTSKLFCDDLDKHINEITDARQISRKIIHSNRAEKNNRKYMYLDRQNTSLFRSGHKQLVNEIRSRLF